MLNKIKNKISNAIHYTLNNKIKILKAGLKTSLFTAIFFSAYFIPVSLLTYNTDLITFKKGNHTIVVQGMIHQAPEDFFLKTENNIEAYKKIGFNYYFEQVTGTAEEQQEFFDLNNGVMDFVSNLTNSLNFSRQSNFNKITEGIRADTDLKTVIKDYKENDIKLITKDEGDFLVYVTDIGFFGLVKNSEISKFYLKGVMRVAFRHAEIFGGQPDFDKHIVNKRNDILLSTIDRNKNAFVTYGQLHLKDITMKLKKEGYEQISIAKISVF